MWLIVHTFWTIKFLLGDCSKFVADSTLTTDNNSHMEGPQAVGKGGHSYHTCVMTIQFIESYS